ncbi:MAG: DnaD domain protein [Bacilli bacterium]|nr:DnaD domain protein [Bacilli bacterium]
MRNLLPADTYIVVNKTILNDSDRKILTMLYQPIIGSISTNLYNTLCLNLDKNEFMSDEFTHHSLMVNNKINLEDILEAREKLEGIGLLKTFVKEKEDSNSYVYELFSPLSASEFFSHPILNIVLYNNVGKKEYERLVLYFKVPRVNLSEYEDITKSFDDVFSSVPSSSFINNMIDIKEVSKNSLKLNYNFDYDLLISSFPKETINEKTFNKENRELIEYLSYIYNLDTLEIKDLITSSLNDKLMIDKVSLRKNARNYYQYQNSGKLPTLIYQNQPDYLRSPEGKDSKRAKMVYTFETTSPYNFLKSKYNGSKPTSRDLKLIEDLMVDVGLKPGVVNVLIDYALRVNNNKLNKAFIETIAGQWARLGIETADAAMNQASKESKSKKVKETIYKKKEVNLPEWFNKENTKEEISKDEEDEVKKLLEDFS